MRKYEATFIFRTEEDAYARGKQLINKEFSGADVKVLKEDDWGIRQLAYPVMKESKGHYFYFDIEVAPDKILEMEKNIRLSSDVLKYLFVRNINK